VQDHTYTDSSPAVNGRVLLELIDGKITVYPIADTDEQARAILAAVLDHIAGNLRGD
jgi:hypothetical protein